MLKWRGSMVSEGVRPGTPDGERHMIQYRKDISDLLPVGECDWLNSNILRASSKVSRAVGERRAADRKCGERHRPTASRNPELSDICGRFGEALVRQNVDRRMAHTCSPWSCRHFTYLRPQNTFIDDFQGLLMPFMIVVCLSYIIIAFVHSSCNEAYVTTRADIKSQFLQTPSLKVKNPKIIKRAMSCHHRFTF